VRQRSDRLILFVRATGLVNGKPGFSDPQGTKTPKAIDMKLELSDYVRDITIHAKFGDPVCMGGGAICCYLSLFCSPCNAACSAALRKRRFNCTKLNTNDVCSTESWRVTSSPEPNVNERLSPNTLTVSYYIINMPKHIDLYGKGNEDNNNNNTQDNVYSAVT